MEAPISKDKTVETPEGLALSSSVARTATLVDPDDLSRLAASLETETINGRTFEQYFDATTQRYTFTTPAGRNTVTAIDNQGRLLSMNVHPSIDNVIFGYDPQGRLAQTGQGNQTWTYGYDDLNRLMARTDPMGHKVSYIYDAADRVSQVILPSGRTYGFGYDNNGNRTSITMPSGAVHGLGYNKINLDNSYVPPNNPAYGTGYNLDREWIRATLPSGKTIDGAYDTGGRQTGTAYPEAFVSLGYSDNTDRVSTLTRTSTPSADIQQLAFSYDGFLTTRVAYSGVANGEYRYSFDNNFWITAIALDNVWTTLGRDADGLLTQYGPFTITRNGPAGAPSGLTDGALSVTYSYDSFGRLASRTHIVAGQTIYGMTLGYDNVGRISTKTENVSGMARVFYYTYDLDGQLVEVRRDGILVEQYGYDPNGNRTSTLTTSTTYDEQDRLIQQGGVSYTFDDDGYLTTRGSDTFGYSARGELLSAAVGGTTITYQYDGMSRRIGKTDGTGTTQYLYGNPGSPFQMTASRDAAGVRTSYFYDTAGNLYAFERGGARYYVATDQLGSPKVVTDTAGNAVKVVEYDAWGVKISDTNPTFDLSIGFAGGIPESATGLVRFGFRDYEPGSGRWTAKDPIFFRGGQPNLYVFALNDPVNRKDPSGLAGLDSVLEWLGKKAIDQIIDWGAGKTADKIMGSHGTLNDINDVNAMNKWESEKRAEDWFNSYPIPPYNPLNL
jgi:RHS repeat-associated protein